MLSKVFSVRDFKAEAYLSPFLFHTKGQAVRAFTDSCKDNNTQFCKHPEDFGLFELGTFDDNTGKILPYDSPLLIGIASDFIS